MRRFILSLFAVTVTFLLGIGAATFFTAPDYGRIMLDVSSHDGGMVCSTNEYLELRVYTSGLIEGDVSSSDCRSNKRSAHLDVHQLDELITLLKKPELLAGKSDYPQFVIQDDTSTVTTIKFEDGAKVKKITLINPDPTYASNRANYPTALINLLLEIQQIRLRLEAPVK